MIGAMIEGLDVSGTGKYKRPLGLHYSPQGADLRVMSSSVNKKRVAGSTMRNMLNGARKLISAVLDCSKPVIAAVQGRVSGMGAHLIQKRPSEFKGY